MIKDLSAKDTSIIYEVINKAACAYQLTKTSAQERENLWVACTRVL